MATWRVVELDWAQVQSMMSLIEREEISRGLTVQLSLRSIARSLKRSASATGRNAGLNGGAKQYRVSQSDAAAWGHCRQVIGTITERGHRSKPCKLAGNDYLCRAISAKLMRKWAPQQIPGWLMREHPDDESKRVSHKTIYRSLFILARGVLKKGLLTHLRATVHSPVSPCYSKTYWIRDVQRRNIDPQLTC